MSFLVAVRPASVLLQQGQSAGLVGGVVGDSDLHLVQLCHSGSSLRRSGSAGSSRACGGRRAAAGSQGSSSGCDTGNFQKITTSNHSFSLSIIGYNVQRRRGTVRARLERKHQKSLRPCQPCAAQGRRPETSVVPPWFTASSRTLPQNCGRIFLLTAGRFNGRTRRGLVLLLFVRAAPRPFSAPCFLPFSTCRALW